MKTFEFDIRLNDTHRAAVDEQDIAYWRSQNNSFLSDIEIAELLALEQARADQCSCSDYDHTIRRVQKRFDAEEVSQ